MDVYATVLDAVGVRAPGPMEGVSLLPYIRGEDSASLWCSLVAQDDEGGYWLGLRNDRVKYVEDVAGAHRLYDLQVDPEATTDVSSDQESVVLRAQDILAPERKALARWQERS
jgi:arylsulfatase A-like enzyme